jgi:2-hydroxychromene-2-carboxylate isomerase
MQPTIEFIFDFGSPNAYLACRTLPPILERTGAKLEIIPCLLGGIFKATNNKSPFIAYAPIKGSSNTRCWNCAASSPSTDSTSTA